MVEMLVENMFDGEHPSSTYGLPFYPTEMALSIDVSQVPGASWTVMDRDEQRVCHVDVNRRHRATGRDQCTWSYGEGVSNMRWRLRKIASDGLPTRDLQQNLSQVAMHLTT